MKIQFLIFILLLASVGKISGQISGKVFLESESCPGVKIKFKNSKEYTESDFDGNFTLQSENEGVSKNLLIITNLELTVEIENIQSKNNEIKLGNIYIPSFEFLEIDEYEKLSKNEKANCVPFKHYTEILGYYNRNKLEKDYIILNCKNKLKQFEYNSKTRTVKIDWNLLKQCK